MKYMIVAILAIVLIGGYFINKSNNADKERLKQAEIEQSQRLEQNKVDEVEIQKRLEIQKSEIESKKKLKAEQDKVDGEKFQKEIEQAKKDEVDKQIKNIENKVKEVAFDPSSAQFRNQKGNCGEVNAKNKFGGYTGFKKYVYNPESDTLDLESSDKFYTSDVMQILWNAKCN